MINASQLLRELIRANLDVYSHKDVKELLRGNKGKFEDKDIQRVTAIIKKEMARIVTTLEKL